MAAKKRTPTTKTKTAAALGPKVRPTPEQAEKAAAAITGDEDESRGRGRPKADHGLKRTSVLADREQMQRLKMQALREDRHMYELLFDAIGDYLAKAKRETE